ncbi:hypothetical protein ACF3MZ_22050 [Paenibacillaceae bacterium WGS1546]|uniref:hypothetical protein n=1 Tax=Cohnella sp. WGS1546 TaxID=3366810 RepID=UPI00372D868A
MRRMYPLLAAVLLAVLLAGCGANSNMNGAADAPLVPSSADPSSGIETNAATDDKTNETPSGSPDNAEPDGEADVRLMATAKEAIEYMRERDMDALVPLIDPEHGLRFSPYPYVNADTDLAFKPEELPSFNDTGTLYWGSEDGSGEPIELSFRDYYERFVYNKDFADAPRVNVNRIEGVGNAIFNVPDVYPNASYVEFHFPGFDESLEGMDWQSLVLVFNPDGDEWKLTGIVHGQWTI